MVRWERIAATWILSISLVVTIRTYLVASVECLEIVSNLVVGNFLSESAHNKQGNREGQIVL